MRLYLVQHGEAEPKDVDPERHLTEKGRRDAEKMAAFLKPLALSLKAIWHSGKARARETAEVLGSAVKATTAPPPRAGFPARHERSSLKRQRSAKEDRARKSRLCLVEREGLGPTDAVGQVAEAVRSSGDDVMIVGHMPFVSKLASVLVAGDEKADVVAFQNAGVVCLESDDEGNWRARWIVTPDLPA